MHVLLQLGRGVKIFRKVFAEGRGSEIFILVEGLYSWGEGHGIFKENYYCTIPV